MSSQKAVAIVSTSAAKLKLTSGDEHTTGAWSEEITGPYYTFKDAGCDVTIFSVLGGKIPIDAGSLSDDFKTENDKRFEVSGDLALLENSPPISHLNLDAVDILFFAGGHGTCEDFPNACAALATDAYAKGKVVGAVCHGPTALYNATDGNAPLVAGKKVAGFSDSEEEMVGLLGKLQDGTPESKMKALGAIYVPSGPWSENAVRDGRLVTGQNPQSSVKAATLCLEYSSGMPIYYAVTDPTRPMAMVTAAEVATAVPMPADMIASVLGAVPIGFTPYLVGGAPAVTPTVVPGAPATAGSQKKKEKKEKSKKKVKTSKKKKGCC